jgi:hypothetical protein
MLSAVKNDEAGAEGRSGLDETVAKVRGRCSPRPWRPR